MSETNSINIKVNNTKYIKNTELEIDNDVIIGKLVPINNKNILFHNNGLLYKSNVADQVDKIYTNIFNDYYKYEIRKIRTRSERTPIIGDMFCCYNDRTSRGSFRKLT